MVKFDRIFEDVAFPSKKTTSKLNTSQIMECRQNAVQPLRTNNKFIYEKDANGKFVNPFTSDYIKRSLHYMLFGKKPRFAGLLKSGEHINHHVVAVICTYVSIFYQCFMQSLFSNFSLIIYSYSLNSSHGQIPFPALSAKRNTRKYISNGLV
jgi:hypothetical protein